MLRTLVRSFNKFTTKMFTITLFAILNADVVRIYLYEHYVFCFFVFELFCILFCYVFNIFAITFHMFF